MTGQLEPTLFINTSDGRQPVGETRPHAEVIETINGWFRHFYDLPASTQQAINEQRCLPVAETHRLLSLALLGRLGKRTSRRMMLTPPPAPEPTFTPPTHLVAQTIGGAA